MPKQMDAWTYFWIKQPEEYRRAVRFGTFILNQPELPIEWEPVEKQEEQPEVNNEITT